MNKVKKLLKNISKVYNYSIAYYRAFCIKYVITTLLIREHIYEQYTVRINSSEKECVDSGYCKECGCRTPIYFMTNTECLGNCYPKMLPKYAWNNLKQGGIYLEKCCNTGLVTTAWSLKYASYSDSVLFCKFEKSKYIIGYDPASENTEDKQIMTKIIGNNIQIL